MPVGTKPKQFMQIINLKRFHAVNLLSVPLLWSANQMTGFCVLCQIQHWVEMSYLQSFLDIFTRLIYVPTQLTVTCTKATIETLKKV